MSNAILTPTIYAKAGLAFLKNSLVASKKVSLQYTTTSTKLHTVLGVESPVFD